MRFESVTAHAFGPFAGETLRLAPGMNVIWGPNEAGKSSWHAALYFGLCARRRGRGRPERAEQLLIDRHRPWDGSRWEVGVVIRLADGRRVELRHDLAGLVACRATDLALGRDCSDEILAGNDAPDGARWLGLDRRTFLAVACVRQAELLAIRANAGLLQEHLQRAAATGGTDATAAAALDRLEQFRRSNVGATQANAVGPLRRAMDAVATARARLDTARRAHDEHLALAVRADDLEREAAAADAWVRRARAEQARAEAAALRRRLDRARALAERVPASAPPDLPADERLALDVAAALRAWDNRPAVPTLDGPSADQLRAQLAPVPDLTPGDVEPHGSVVAAREALAGAVAAFEQHERSRPEPAAAADADRLTEQELRDLADDLSRSDDHVDPVVAERVAAAQRRVEASGQPRSTLLPLAAGGVAVVLGAVTAALGVLGVGLPLLLIGAGLVIWVLVRRDNAGYARALEELRAAEAALGGRRFAVEDARRRRDAALRLAREHHLPPDPATVRQRADRRRAAALADHDLRRWQTQHASVEAACERARDRLVAALEARGVGVGADVLAALRAYEEDCRRRASQAALAGRRAEIERRVADRLAVERAVSEARRRVQEAEAEVRAVARGCALPDGRPEGLAARLRAWQSDRSAMLTEHDADRRAWAELGAILGTRSLADLEHETRTREAAAERLAAQVGLPQPREAETQTANGVVAPDMIASDMVTPEDIGQLEDEARTALAAATRARGEADQRARMQPSVPEAEEALAAAEAELTRVTSLSRTLDRTRQFLESAEQHVHRDIAPTLGRAVERWLPRVTTRRYSKALVDPETLEVRVASGDGPWRDAALLSHGTTEQLYLLLRVALADRLTSPGTTCPLILDDVTAHLDAERTVAVLDMLRTLSGERQVILFSQEVDVLAWAEANLGEPESRLVRLPAPGAAVP